MARSGLVLRVEVAPDWLALNAYRMALELIVQQADAEPWSTERAEAAAIARTALADFPGSWRP